MTDTPTIVERLAGLLKRAAVWLGKCYGTIILAGIVIEALRFAEGALPGIGWVFYGLQLVVGLGALVVLANLFPDWLVDRIPRVGVGGGGSKRALKTYALYRIFR